MQIVKKDLLKDQFDPGIYTSDSPVVITSDEFWDGGFDITASLREKSKFYNLAESMTIALKKLMADLDEDFYVADFLCENETIYASWSDLKSFALFRAVSETFQKNKCYRLSLKEDSDLIDLMIESNFRYYTYFSFFLPASGIIVQPTCHTEIFIYSEKEQWIRERLAEIIEPNGALKIK